MFFLILPYQYSKPIEYAQQQSNRLKKDPKALSLLGNYAVVTKNPNPCFNYSGPYLKLLEATTSHLAVPMYSYGLGWLGVHALGYFPGFRTQWKHILDS